MINNMIRKVAVNTIPYMLLLVWSCNFFEMDDDVLSIKREDYSGTAIRLDGIYYIERENSEGPYFQRYALYRNGIIRDLGAGKIIDDPNFLSGNSKEDWGIFQINGANVQFERWYPSSGGPLKAYIRSGVIVNDTTFLINESYRILDGNKTEIRGRDEMYHFRQFSPKPDSVSAFIN